MMTETVFTRADLLAAEKQQMRLLKEQQHDPHSQSQHSSFASYAPPFPIISLADDWQLNASPLPPPASSSPAADDFFTSHYLGDDANNSKHFPSSSFSNYSATSDLYPSHAAHSTASSNASFADKLALYDQPFTASLKRSHSESEESNVLPPSKRLTVELPAPAHSQHKKAGGQQSAALQAQYPLLSSELVDGFFASNVNVGSGVMGGLDDSELGLTLHSLSRQATETSSAEKAAEFERAETQIVLPELSLQPQTSQQSEASVSSSTAPSVSFVPSSLSSVLSTLSSSASSPLSNPSSLSNLTNRVLPASTKGEGQRRMKRRLTDKQRRAKIKDGLEQLRSLVALHGNASSDQASIVNSSVDLVQQLVDERDELNTQLRRCGDERAELDREQQLALDKQRLAAAVLPNASAASLSAVTGLADGAASPDLSVLLHHLSNILSPVLGGGGGAVASGGGGNGEAGAGAGVAAAGGLESLVLSQYFLHTLKLLTNMPRNTNA